MNSVQRIGELRLHTQDGVIRLNEPGHPSQHSRLTPREFVMQKVVLDAESIRLLGSRENARLISELHSVRSIGGKPRSVWLGNPAWAPNLGASEESDDYVFQCMAGKEEAASVGGWHQLTEKDYATFALMAEFARAGHRCTPVVEQHLRRHPAWLALSFLPDLSKVAACGLIAAIGDPRWHVDSAKPDRHTKLRAYMGLGSRPELIENLLSGKFPEDLALAPRLKARRLQWVLDTWTGGDYTPPAQDMVGPDGFLWRVYHSVASNKTGFRGMMRACNVFLRFLQSVWLDNLTKAREYERVAKRFRKATTAPKTLKVSRMLPCRTYCPTLFVPEHFFHLKAEVEAWKQHVARCHDRESQ